MTAPAGKATSLKPAMVAAVDAPGRTLAQELGVGVEPVLGPCRRRTAKSEAASTTMSRAAATAPKAAQGVPRLPSRPPPLDPRPDQLDADGQSGKSDVRRSRPLVC